MSAARQVVTVNKKVSSIEQARSTKKKLSVLVIEDDPDYSEVLSGRLGQEEALNIFVASDPYEAAERLTECCYDLVITDWTLSTMRAPQTLRKTDEILRMDSDLPVKWSKRRVPVLIVSGDDHARDVSRIYDFEHFQFVSFLPKQAGLEKIVKKVSRLLK